MQSIAYGFGFITVTAVVVIAGDFFLKLAADRGLTAVSTLVGVGIVLYGISAVLWFAAMQHITLGQAGVAYSMLTLIALALMVRVAG